MVPFNPLLVKSSTFSAVCHVLYNEAGDMQLVTYSNIRASDPLQADATALLHALQFSEVHC